MTQAQKTAKAKFKQAIAYRQKTGVSLKEAFAHIYGRKVGAVNKKSASKKGYINLYSKIGDIEKYNGIIYGVKIAVKKILNSNKQYELKIYDLNNNKSILNIYPETTISDIRNDLALDLYNYISNNSTQNLTNKDLSIIKPKLFTYLKLLAAELKRLNKKPIKKAVPKKKVAKKQYGYNLKLDKLYSAKKPGKRKSASGKTYYENRPNRTDINKFSGMGKITDFLTNGILAKIKNAFYEINKAEKQLDYVNNQIKQFGNKITPEAKKSLIKSREQLKKYIKENKTHTKELKKSI